MKYQGKALFFTLTYREDLSYFDNKLIYPYHTDNIPDPPRQCVPRFIDIDTGEFYRTVYKKHVQDALKRFREFRRKNDLSTSFSYFITSEYGPRTLRPHYHGIVFGLTRQEFLPFLHDWSFRFGFYDCKVVKYGKKSQFTVSSYVAKYCAKGFFENPLVKQRKVLPTFHLISKKIGYNYVTTHSGYHLDNKSPSSLFNRNSISTLVDRMCYTFVRDYTADNQTTVFKYSLPKYYKEYIYGTKNLLRYRMYQEICKRNDDLYCQKLKQIQSERCCTSNEAVRYLDMQASSDKVYREKQLQSSLAKYYDKSPI